MDSKRALANSVPNTHIRQDLFGAGARNCLKGRYGGLPRGCQASDHWALTTASRASRERTAVVRSQAGIKQIDNPSWEAGILITKLNDF